MKTARTKSQPQLSIVSKFISNIKSIDKTKIRIFIKKYIITLFFIVLLLKTIKILQVKDINCLINNSPCSETYYIDVSTIKNHNILFINKNNIIKSIINHNPIVANVIVDKKIPNSINIYLTKRKASYLLITKQQTLMIDEEGMALALTDDIDRTELVPIETEESFAVGQKIVSPAILSAMNLAKLLQNSALSVKTISTSDINEVVIFLHSGILLRFNGERDINKQVDSVKLILDKPSEKDKLPIKEIDLRYDDPIIRN